MSIVYYTTVQCVIAKPISFLRAQFASPEVGRRLHSHFRYDRFRKYNEDRF